MQIEPMTAADGTNAAARTTMIELTTKIVAAFLSHNALAVADLPAVIRAVHGALSGATTPVRETVAGKPIPAVSIKKSVRPDYIVCLEDGKKLKMLKRHLASAYGLTPDAYRAKWGLPPDYPMTAATYAAERSSFAKSAGFGRKAAPVAEAAPARRPGRPKKSAA